MSELDADLHRLAIHGAILDAEGCLSEDEIRKAVDFALSEFRQAVAIMAQPVTYIVQWTYYYGDGDTFRGESLIRAVETSEIRVKCIKQIRKSTGIFVNNFNLETIIYPIGHPDWNYTVK